MKRRASVAAGTIVVVAAGNNNADTSGFKPANCDCVISVARTGGRATYSNYGSLIDVAAPGGDSPDIYSTDNFGATAQGAQGYGQYWDTSAASPHVAGTLALMQSANVNTPAMVEALLESTARPSPVACAVDCGAGIIDASLAISAAINAIRFIDDVSVSETFQINPGSAVGATIADSRAIGTLSNDDSTQRGRGNRSTGAIGQGTQVIRISKLAVSST